MAADIPIYIIRIAEKKFEIKEELFRKGVNNIRYNIEHKIGFSHNDWINFNLRIYYAYTDNIKDIVIDIIVENIFHIPNLKDYVKISNSPIEPDDMNLPSKVLISLVEMSLSHSRAILFKCKAGGAYDNINLPYINAVEVARKFFGGKIEVS